MTMKTAPLYFTALNASELQFNGTKKLVDRCEHRAITDGDGAIKKYERESNHDGLIDVSVTALFTTRKQADTYLHLTPDIEAEIEEVQVSGSIDLGGIEVIRD